MSNLHLMWLYLKLRMNVRGWLNADGAKLLYYFAAFGPMEGDIVEIGSAWGKSTIVLASASKRAKRENVWAVDPHTGGKRYLGELGLKSINSYPEFIRNINKFKVNDWINPIVKTSEEAAMEWRGFSIRLLWIDGWHTYEAVKKDFYGWAPHVIKGGVIIFDDYLNKEFPDYKKGIDEILNSNIMELPLRVVGQMAYTFKK